MRTFRLSPENFQSTNPLFTTPDTQSSHTTYTIQQHHTSTSILPSMVLLSSLPPPSPLPLPLRSLPHHHVASFCHHTFFLHCTSSILSHMLWYHFKVMLSYLAPTLAPLSVWSSACRGCRDWEEASRNTHSYTGAITAGSTMMGTVGTDSRTTDANDRRRGGLNHIFTI